jgi:hypothetical protein
MGVGASRWSTFAGDEQTQASGKDRVSLGLRRQSTSTSFGLQLARDAQLNEDAAPVGLSDSVAVNVNHRFTNWLQLGGTYRLTQNQSTLASNLDHTDMTARAALSLQELGALELRYNQSEARDGVRFDGAEPTRGYGVRYQLGAREGQAGFGLMVDYSARLEPNAPIDNYWRLGITYR